MATKNDLTERMISIGRATADDSEQIWAIFEQVITAADTYTYPSDMTREQALDAWLYRQGNQTFVARLDGEIVGTYYLRQNWPGPGSHIANASFMVSDGARGKGIGKAMAEHALTTARSIGFRAMQFNMVVSTNLGALHLWKTLGFRIIGTIPRAFNHPEQGLVDAHIMYREL